MKPHIKTGSFLTTVRGKATVTKIGTEHVASRGGLSYHMLTLDIGGAVAYCAVRAEELETSAEISPTAR